MYICMCVYVRMFACDTRMCAYIYIYIYIYIYAKDVNRNCTGVDGHVI